MGIKVEFAFLLPVKPPLNPWKTIMATVEPTSQSPEINPNPGTPSRHDTRDNVRINTRASARLKARKSSGYLSATSDDEATLVNFQIDRGEIHRGSHE